MIAEPMTPGRSPASIDVEALPRRCRRSRRPAGPWTGRRRRRPAPAGGPRLSMQLLVGVHRDQRHQLAAVLHDPAVVRRARWSRARSPPAARPAPAAPPSGTPEPARNSSSGTCRPRRSGCASSPGVGGSPSPQMPHLAGRLGDAVGIEDHDHAAVAQDGVAREHRMWRRIGATGFTTISSVSNTRSTMMPKVLGADLGHDDEGVVLVASPSPSVSSSLSRSETSGSSRSRRRRTGAPLMLLDLQLAVRRRAHQLDHADLRDREALARAFDDQGRDDGQRQRDLDGEASRPCPRSERSSTVPPIFSMLVLTTSMPTPRPETLVTCGRGREAGLEDELLDLLVAHRVRARPRWPGPLATIFAWICRIGRPLPSSAISMMMWPPS